MAQNETKIRNEAMWHSGPILLFFLLHCRVHADYVTTPLPKSYGIWEGWGTSLAWWAKAYGNRDDLADAFFTLQNTINVNNSFGVPGLGLNIVRYNAGATSDTAAGGSRTPVRQRKRLLPRRGLLAYLGRMMTNQWDWSRDQNQRKCLQKAAQRGADVFQLFSNSPVWWMCDNHNPSGSATGRTDNLQTWNRRNLHKYLATIADHFKSVYNITFQVSNHSMNQIQTGGRRTGPKKDVIFHQYPSYGVELHGVERCTRSPRGRHCS